eukprot:3711876-Pyramimonas_sp.AAC.1
MYSALLYGEGKISALTFEVVDQCRQRTDVPERNPLLKALPPHKGILVDQAVDPALTHRGDRSWTTGNACAIAIIPDVVLESCRPTVSSQRTTLWSERSRKGALRLNKKGRLCACVGRFWIKTFMK